MFKAYFSFNTKAFPKSILSSFIDFDQFPFCVPNEDSIGTILHQFI